MDDRQPMSPSGQPDPAIRDFLKIPQDVDACAGAHEDGSPTARDADGGGGMVNWKPLRDRLRLRRVANAWLTSPAPKAGGALAATTATTNSSINNRSNKYNYSPGEAAAAFSRTFSRAPSLRTTPTFSSASSTGVGPASFRPSSRRRASYELRYVEEHRDEDNNDHDGEKDDDDDEEEDDEEEEGKEEAPAAQMSLMALLEQTDSWDDDEEEEGGGEARKNGGGTAGDDDEDDGEGREEEMVHVCCVCMVRHKGAAFIPCGHTFCRLCSRELWVSRGNCPLCNGFIQEILDIF